METTLYDRLKDEYKGRLEVSAGSWPTLVERLKENLCSKQNLMESTIDDVYMFCTLAKVDFNIPSFFKCFDNVE